MGDLQTSVNGLATAPEDIEVGAEDARRVFRAAADELQRLVSRVVHAQVNIASDLAGQDEFPDIACMTGVCTVEKVTFLQDEHPFCCVYVGCERVGGGSYMHVDVDVRMVSKGLRLVQANPSAG